MTDHERLMYQVLGCISEADAPIVFKGALIVKLILAENGYSSIERPTRDIDANWTGTPPSMAYLSDIVNQSLRAFDGKLYAEATREYSERKSAGIAIIDGESGDRVISMDISMKPVIGSRAYYHGETGIRGVLANEILADKISVLSGRMIFRRAKDVIDVFALAHCVNVKTSEIRVVYDRHPDRNVGAFGEFIDRRHDVEHAYEMLKGIENKPPFDQVYKYLNQFLQPFISNDMAQKTWNCEKMIWESDYIAHTREIDDEEQLLIDHLNNTAERASIHAASWGSGEFARLCGLVHDVGKYSKAFQTRIRGGKNFVDHATAGGQLLHNEYNQYKIGRLMAYCVMGHHGGLPDGGAQNQKIDSDSTLISRLNRHIPDYSAYKSEIALPRLEKFAHKWADGFDMAFFVRMIFSAIVDADWLDTEKFCLSSNAPRGGFSSILELKKRLEPKIDKYFNPEGEIKEIIQKRNQLLRDCISASSQPAGLFSLTAPTGSGKTFASLAFALNHAVEHGKRRVIYVVPYNTIIDQSATEFEKHLGVENVLRHVGDVEYDEEDGISINKRHSVENWDFPVIVTSSVQFFESLFANKPARCRKLHNIAESVLVFDEAQMIPIPYLLPCVRAIKTLVMQYNCTAVLATATQSALDKVFLDEPHGKPLHMTEISENPQDMYDALRRTRILIQEEPYDDTDLVSRLLENERVLCIVNTRHHAQSLFEQLHKVAPEGSFHLSTTMTSLHRKDTLKKIHELLEGENKQVCRVISTSMVEAGVDFDFEKVFRERAGLDSIIQAAGRCNRKGERSIDDSIVEVFTSTEGKPSGILRSNIGAYEQIANRYDDVADLDAIRAYFEQLFYNLGEKEYLDSKKIMQMFIEGGKSVSFPFSDVAKKFKLIDDKSQKTVYVLDKAQDLEARLYAGERSKKLFRELGKYTVSLFDKDIMELEELGAIKPDISDQNIKILFEKYYGEYIGVILSPKGGQGLFSS